MNVYYEVKCQYEKIDDEGKQKKVTESYLVDALSCTEAEAIITREIKQYISGEFEVKNVKKTNIYELFERDLEGKWYACRLAMITIDDKGKGKKFPVLVYVRASDVRDAETFIMSQIEKGMADWIVKSVTETKIIDVLKHE